MMRKWRWAQIRVACGANRATRPQLQPRPRLIRRHYESLEVSKKPHKGSYAADKHEAFQELRLKEKVYDNPIGRVRQHVNPLSIEYQTESEPLEWDEVYKDPTLPLIVDAGTGYGRFPLLAATKLEEPMNYLGTDIRHPLVGRSNFWAKELGLNDRVHFTFANITISLRTLLRGYPGDIVGVYIQFPDPCFKRRALKRHIVQPDFVQACSDVLRPGGAVFMQSDVESCATYTRNMFDYYGSQNFDPHTAHSNSGPLGEDEDYYLGKELKWSRLSWLEENPIGLPTEREVYSQEQGLPVYRTFLVRKDSNC